MKRFIKGALCALAFSCAADAYAVTYTRYNISARGTGGITTVGSSGPLYSTLEGYNFSFVVSDNPVYLTTTATGQTFNGVISAVDTFFGSPVATTSATGLTFNQSGSNPRGGAGGFASVTVCGAAGATFPSAAFAVDPSCSAVRVEYAGVSAFSVFTGNVTGISVEVLDTFPGNVGFTRLSPIIPEPSTWALMLAGFGLTGYALRRRRARVAFA